MILRRCRAIVGAMVSAGQAILEQQRHEAELARLADSPAEQALKLMRRIDEQDHKIAVLTSQLHQTAKNRLRITALEGFREHLKTLPRDGWVPCGCPDCGYAMEELSELCKHCLKVGCNP